MGLHIGIDIDGNIPYEDNFGISPILPIVAEKNLLSEGNNNNNNDLKEKENFNFNSNLYINNNNNNDNQYNVKMLFKENEHLKDKFKKYERKYIKHKSIGKSYKNISKNLKKDIEKQKGNIYKYYLIPINYFRLFYG
jgi:hypothetical protein